jgi:catechol 2,3-dioxygenase-like lactoylglutathione lyase family enzyme
MPETGAATRITQVGTVIVTVSDQDQAVEFFTEKLGFEKRSDSAYGDGQRWVDVAPSGASTTIAVVPPMGRARPVGDRHRSPPRTSTPTTPTCAIAESTLTTRSCGWASPVPPMFFFRDPDGNRYLIVGEPD